MAPRDGSNIYSQPFPDVVEDTTIESTVYNGFTNDVAADLNAPRPIVAGGTGATSADQALFNLAAEKAAQVVTNYDSHLWVPGSFRSATTATGSPVTDHAFAGVCYINEALANPPTNQNVVVEALDITDSTNIVKYIRVKTSGVWGSWSGVGGGSAAASIGEYTFDTGITFPPGSGQIRLNNATQNSATEIFISHTTVLASDNTNLIPFAIKSGSDIAIQDKDEIAKYKIFTATANPVLSGGDYRVTAVFKSGGTDIATAQRVLIGATMNEARYGLKNYIINGAMQISQENGETGVSTSGSYAADCFSLSLSHAGLSVAAHTASRTPGGSQWRYRLTCSTADASVAAGDFLQIFQSIEGNRCADLKFGTANAKTVTIQFGCRGPAGTYGVTLSNAAGARSYTAEYVISVGEANTDVVKSVTIPGDTAGTWVTDNNSSMVIHWGFMCGITYQQASGAWTGNNVVSSTNQFNFMGTVGNVFELFDVSLTEGTVAPPFQVSDYASELAACQRYFNFLKIETNGYCPAASVPFCQFVPFPTTMRAPPTLITNGDGTNTNVASGSFDTPTIEGCRVIVVNAAAGPFNMAGRTGYAKARL